MTPEFSRPVAADTVSEQARRVEIGADETERRKLAGRFGLQRLERLSAELSLQRRAGLIHAEGRVLAAVVQNCVITTDPIPAQIDAPFAVRYVEDGYSTSGEEEFELSAEDCDTLPILEGRIDLGELAAETLALALDPFPRSPGADSALAEAGLDADQPSGPFAALQALKDQLGKE